MDMVPGVMNAKSICKKRCHSPAKACKQLRIEAIAIELFVQQQQQHQAWARKFLFPNKEPRWRESIEPKGYVSRKLQRATTGNQKKVQTERERLHFREHSGPRRILSSGEKPQVSPCCAACAVCVGPHPSVPAKHRLCVPFSPPQLPLAILTPLPHPLQHLQLRLQFVTHF